MLETLPAPAWFGTGVKIGYIFAVRLVETVLGNVFIWSSSMFYTVYRHAPEWGITPVHDLNLGGIVMMAEGSIVTLGVLVWLFLRMAAEGELRQRLLEQGLDRGRCSGRCATAAPTGFRPGLRSGAWPNAPGSRSGTRASGTRGRGRSRAVSSPPAGLRARGSARLVAPIAARTSSTVACAAIISSSDARSIP